MIWVQDGGKKAPPEAVEVALRAAAEQDVPVGILLGTAECETNFRLGLVSKDGAVGPVQFLPRYAKDYYRYAGFMFDLYEWDAIRGIAAVYKKYAKWATERHGLKGEDVWRFAVSAHRYGQNSKTCLDMSNKRVKDIERHMRRNGIWYTEKSEPVPVLDFGAGNEKKFAAVAKSAAEWAMTKLGCPYSQVQRAKEGIFDCSSLVARAYEAVGVSFAGGGLAKYPTSNLEVYSDQFELIWPETYDVIGKVMGGKSVLDRARQPGDLQFIRTQSGTTRNNRITHATILSDKSTIVHARGTAYGVVTSPYTLYQGKVCAVMRYNPDAPLRKGMRGNRVLALQKALNAKGARLSEDGQFGEKTEKAVQKYGLD